MCFSIEGRSAGKAARSTSIGLEGELGDDESKRFVALIHLDSQC